MGAGRRVGHNPAVVQRLGGWSRRGHSGGDRGQSGDGSIGYSGGGGRGGGGYGIILTEARKLLRACGLCVKSKESALAVC
jgi:hypothetical protein